MSSVYGKNIKISIFGQSHSEAIGVVIDGLPSGFEIDIGALNAFMARRAPGKNNWSTARSEPDEPQIVSGVVGGKTCGAPLCALICNKDTRSKDYESLKNKPRPGHADFTSWIKTGGAADFRGGGHFSGRLTAPLCFAGAICLQMLEKRGVTVGAHIASVGNARDVGFDPVYITASELKAVSGKEFPVIDDSAAAAMKEVILQAGSGLDSVGGIIECCAVGLPAGLGDPMFDGVENRIAQAVFAIPAVKGVEFGSGFGSADMRGSQSNDEFYFDGEKIKTRTNNHGGVLGGITSGMPLVFRAAFKPTPSIARQQNTVDIAERKNVKLEIKGRHDPCIVPRAVPCVEAAAAIVLADMIF
ncbi:MAG: chorismate synthase [Clostridia bacterium]|nr:chorismate synthase [Clostridia bacterium]